MLERSSPGRYCRYSSNSTLNPLNGLRWSPERNPSTTVRAFSSSVPSLAMTAGSRNRSSPGRAWLGMGLQAALGDRNCLEQPRHDAIRVDALGFCIEVRNDSVPQDRRRKCLEVLDGDVMPSVHQRAGLRTENQRLRGAEPGAPFDVLLHELEGTALRGARRGNQPHGIAGDFVGDNHLPHHLLEIQNIGAAEHAIDA